MDYITDRQLIARLMFEEEEEMTTYEIPSLGSGTLSISICDDLSLVPEPIYEIEEEK